MIRLLVHKKIELSPCFRVGWVQRAVRFEFIANVLHHGDTLAQEEPIVFQHRQLLLWVFL